VTDVDTTQTRRALAALLGELVEGANAESGYVLNPKDPGLLYALDRLSASEASHVPTGHRSSVAAHADHLRYGIDLMNQWADGDDPFGDADYTASWRRVVVTDSEWSHLRAELKRQLEIWSKNLAQPRAETDTEHAGVIASVVHLAYHFGAIRQIVPAVAGPRAAD